MLTKSAIQRRSRWLWCLRRISAISVGVALLLTPSAASAANEDVPQPLAWAIVAALDGWSRFATTGDLADLGSSFVVGGPQWRQFEAESVAWLGQADADPLRLEIREFRLRHLDSATATVWGKVEASGTGYVSEVFGWDFDLIRDNGRWRVWTVMSADRPLESAQVPAPSAPGVTSTTSTIPAASVPQPARGEAVMTASTAEPSRGTRLPVLSAWIVVVTVVGVAVAGYVAPRLDGRGEG